MNFLRILSLRILMVLILTFGVSFFAANAQKEESTSEAGDETDVLSLPLILSGEVIDLSFEGTNGALLAAFNASEGDVVDISMTAVSETLDPFIVVFDWSTIPIAANDDSDGLDSLIEGLEIPADGTYFILATTFFGASSEDTDSSDGEFQLSVEGNTQPADVDVDSFTYLVSTVGMGESYDVEINAETPAYFIEFEGEAGQLVTIDAPSDELDTLMMLFDVDGNRIAVDDDGGDEPLAAHIEVELPESGYYLLLLTTYNYDEIATGTEVTDGIIFFTIE